jgi:hemerythrin-like metal-binding protein
MNTTEAPNLKLGDPTLDEDHTELQRLIDDMTGAPVHQVLEKLEALRAHAAKHFAVEDEDLRRMKDGNASCHLDEHAAVLKSLGEVRDIIAQGASSVEIVNMVVPLCAELNRWLPEHVQAMDAGVAIFRTKTRFGGAPIVISRRQPSA